jgi:hypothetical protein
VRSKVPDDFDEGRFELDVGDALGASAPASVQVLTLYIPDKDREGNELGTQRQWVLEAAERLAPMGRGVTIMPPAEGAWYDEENDRIVWEHPVLGYTYIVPEPFLQRLGELREFLHRMGRETNQGEVVCEFDGQFYRITSYDPRRESAGA